MNILPFNAMLVGGDLIPKSLPQMDYSMFRPHEAKLLNFLNSFTNVHLYEYCTGILEREGGEICMYGG